MLWRFRDSHGYGEGDGDGFVAGDGLGIGFGSLMDEHTCYGMSRGDGAGQADDPINAFPPLDVSGYGYGYADDAGVAL